MSQAPKISDAALSEFVAECEELTQRVYSCLNLIEKGEHTSDTLDSIYRDMHTIKGSAHLFGFSDIGQVAHAMETSLDPVRRGRCELKGTLLETLYECLSLIEQMIELVKNKEERSFEEELLKVIPVLIEASVNTLGMDFKTSNDPPGLKENLEKPAPSENTPQNEQKIEPDPPPPEVTAAPEPETKTLEVQKISKPIEEKKMDSPSPPPQKTKEPESKSTAAMVDSSSTIRVPVSLLDKLMALMGEMVLVRNQVLQYSNQSDDLNFLNLSQRLDLVTSELQGSVMQTRMQPIGNVLTKFQRVIRDLSKSLNKKIELSLAGTETELDKTLLEAVKDPLTHIIRNACDHGIETPEARNQAGKPSTGHINIRAFHEGGQVLVEIIDDGKGLDKDKIIAKAIERGIISQEKGAKMKDREICDLIFAPGFSTAAQVTNVSGRGVGMDVVRNNIEKIGGMVELETEYGKGTKFRLKIPLTLAIVPAMIIQTNGERFAIPQVKLVELVRVEKNQNTDQIEFLQGRPMYRLRGDLLPLVDLKEVLGTVGLAPKERNSEVTNIVVLNADRKLFGLIVDEIQDTADIVVKPLSQFLKSLSVYSGATVMGDGSVALILDVIGLANRSDIFEESQIESDDELGSDVTDARAKLEDAQEFLLFEINATGKYAIPLGLVHRLEEFKRSSIEITGGQRVIRYRKSILPVISLNEFLGFEDKSESPVVSVIVVRKQGRMFGIQVDDIIDVKNISSEIDDTIRDRPGIMGNIISGDEVLVVVDILTIVDTEIKRLNHATPDEQKRERTKELSLNEVRGKFKILLAEDTVFFRKQIQKCLEQAGFQVDSVVDGAKALEKMETEGDNFSLVLSDIEMPNMNGFELAQSLRKQDKWKTIPLVALTTKFSDRHVKEGLAAGFNRYLEKLNPDKLINELDNLLSVGGGS